MAYETKALLALLADAAVRTDSKKMYNIIAKAANTEGLVLKSFAEAKAEMENEED